MCVFVAGPQRYYVNSAFVRRRVEQFEHKNLFHNPSEPMLGQVLKCGQCGECNVATWGVQ